ncbi:hypothetical protein PV08_07327 [Exophiala spinifera]|uniref:Uncharacterized protein n=1 Tax=Exophiala spinifera TaxID=91928 RepID=A0A0D2B6P7_9EURO|nr:uncharacterized protein PV08_07327 [Exophiala spinifera]KIW14543.1 hypothetical protein PV08_07327 [Exophiala spinifera]
MAQIRQQAFLRLRAPCVELSSTALKFKANQVSAKAVLLALEPVYQALQSLGNENLLDAKLAEYAFFPLTHIFNQSRQFPSSVLELTVKCVHILVSQGWRDKIAPEMGKQLLILMGLLVSPSAGQHSEPATDELKVAAFDCMSDLILQLSKSGADVLEGPGERRIVDQLVYQLLESMADAPSDMVQRSAAQALFQLVNSITDRPLLASLLPRTVSTLVKVLRPSTEARRTRKVLVAYLNLLTILLKKVLADSAVSSTSIDMVGRTNDDTIILDEAWLEATVPQIDIALVQVIKLRTHDSPEVSKALLDLCLTIIEDCPQTLARSLPLIVETLVVLCRFSESSEANAALRHIMISRQDVLDVLKAKFYDWSQALPRVMQGNDDRPKQHMLDQVATSFLALTDVSDSMYELNAAIGSILVDGISAAIASTSTKSSLVNEAPYSSGADLIPNARQAERTFAPVVLNHQSQRGSTQAINKLIEALKDHQSAKAVTRSLIDHIQDPDNNRSLSATWLALRFVQGRAGQLIDMDDFIMGESSPSDLSLSRPFLISDLYAMTLPWLLESSESYNIDKADWRLIAFSLEALVLQATQLGSSYRPELVETLFPVLTLLGSRNPMLQQHAMTTLNLLATACDYASVSELLIENVDYLINALALRLNLFDVSREGLQVLSMMIRLCGAKVLPYLDDLIGSIFGALDNFHGYPALVEQLFEILKLVVEESTKQPELLAIDSGTPPKDQRITQSNTSTFEDIINDLQARKERKSKTDDEHEQITSAPHRPWSSTNTDNHVEDDDPQHEGEGEGAEEEPPAPADKSNGAAVSKAHQLLLNIGQAAGPHLSSPSAKVRLTLLALLQDLCLLLEKDENSFLPLVNAVWPAVVPRLVSSKDKSMHDMPYTIQAAADTIAIICQAAGNFMSSRIDEIFSDAEALFRQTYESLSALKTGRFPHTGGNVQLNNSMVSSEQSLALRVSGEPGDGGVSRYSVDTTSRSSNVQLLGALTGLFVSILNNVRVSDDNADRAFTLLAPLLDSRFGEQVRPALVNYNEDAVWLLERQSKD